MDAYAHRRPMAALRPRVRTALAPENPPPRARTQRVHIRRYGTTPDGRVFQTSRGGIIQDSAYSAVWADARQYSELAS
jgi:hypothetical protein